MPFAPTLEAIFCTENEEGRKQHAVGENVNQVWESEHRVFYHDKLPPIKLDKDKLFRTQPCHDHGVCVCGQCEASSPDALQFHRKLVSRLKMLCVKSKTHISEPRLLLETARLVIKVFSSPVENSGGEASEPELEIVPHESQEYFFLIGYINLQTWNFSVVQLKKVCDQNENGYMQLVPVGVDEPSSNHGVRTSVQFAADCLDLLLMQRVLILKLVEDDAPLSLEHMLGSCVEVGPLKGSYPFTVWRGSVIEEKYYKEKDGRKRKGDGKTKPFHHAKPSDTTKRSGHAKRRKRHGALTDKHYNAGDEVDATDADDEGGGSDSGISIFFGDDNEDDSSSDSSGGASRNESVVGSEADWLEPSEHSTILGIPSGSDPEGLTLNPHSDLDLDALMELPNSPGSCEAANREDDEVADEAGGNPESGSGSNDNSSSSSSSSLSTSSSISAQREGGPRRTPISEYVMKIGNHELHYNVSGSYFRAHCAVHDGCRRQRTAMPSSVSSSFNAGQGRPIGLLTDWLERANEFPNKEAHMRDKARTRTQDQRAAARQRFKAMSRANTLLQFERDQDENENSEPSKIL